MASIDEIAEKNLDEKLNDNPCRGIAVGKGKNGNIMQFAWIMGRSENSQNRIYETEGDIVRTKARDPSKMKNPELVIYNAMRSLKTMNGNYAAHIASNGDQTDTVHDSFEQTGWGISAWDFIEALETRYCEPDAFPQANLTPRITLFCSEDLPGRAYLSLIKADPRAKEFWKEAVEEYGPSIVEALKEKGLNGNALNEQVCIKLGEMTGLNHREFLSQRSLFEVVLTKGHGHCLTTYMPGSNALPSFEGEPFIIPLGDSLEGSMQKIWNSLEPSWKVALAAKEITEKSYRVQTLSKFNEA